MALEYFWVVLPSYLLGGVPFGYIAARMRGIDITKYGSGATGATNVLRTMGTLPAIIVALLDISKGVLVATATGHFYGVDSYAIRILAGLSAMVGHSFSPYLGFRGGKSVAVGAGVVITLMPAVILYAVAVFILVVATTRFVSLGSILGALTALASSLALEQPAPYVWFLAAAVSLVVFQHRSNITRLLSGKENRIGQKVNLK